MNENTNSQSTNIIEAQQLAQLTLPELWARFWGPARGASLPAAVPTDQGISIRHGHNMIVLCAGSARALTCIPYGTWMSDTLPNSQRRQSLHQALRRNLRAGASRR